MAIQTVVATVNGQQITLTYNNSTGKYEATVAAPSTTSFNVNAEHYYPVQITATDVAGNRAIADDNDGVLGEYLRLKVKEKTAPITVVTFPTEGSTIVNNTPTIKWTVSDEDMGSGVDSSTISLTLPNGEVVSEAIQKTPMPHGYQCSYMVAAPLADGSNILRFNAKDFDGNSAAQKVVNFLIDTTAPSLIIISPDSINTNQRECIVSGTTSDTTSSPVTLRISLNGVDQGVIHVDDLTGAFTKMLVLDIGVNELLVTATDRIGKATSVSRTVCVDIIPPNISRVSITPNPIDCSATYVISITVTD